MSAHPDEGPHGELPEDKPDVEEDFLDDFDAAEAAAIDEFTKDVPSKDGTYFDDAGNCTQCGGAGTIPSFAAGQSEKCVHCKGHGTMELYEAAENVKALDSVEKYLAVQIKGCLEAIPGVKVNAIMEVSCHGKTGLTVDAEVEWPDYFPDDTARFKVVDARMKGIGLKLVDLTQSSDGHATFFELAYNTPEVVICQKCDDPADWCGHQQCAICNEWGCGHLQPSPLAKAAAFKKCLICYGLGKYGKAHFGGKKEGQACNACKGTGLMPANPTNLISNIKASKAALAEKAELAVIEALSGFELATHATAGVMNTGKTLLKVVLESQPSVDDTNIVQVALVLRSKGYRVISASLSAPEYDKHRLSFVVEAPPQWTNDPDMTEEKLEWDAKCQDAYEKITALPLMQAMKEELENVPNTHKEIEALKKQLTENLKVFKGKPITLEGLEKLKAQIAKSMKLPGFQVGQAKLGDEPGKVVVDLVVNKPADKIKMTIPIQAQLDTPPTLAIIGRQHIDAYLGEPDLKNFFTEISQAQYEAFIDAIRDEIVKVRKLGTAFGLKLNYLKRNGAKHLASFTIGQVQHTAEISPDSFSGAIAAAIIPFMDLNEAEYLTKKILAGMGIPESEIWDPKPDAKGDVLTEEALKKALTEGGGFSMGSKTCEHVWDLAVDSKTLIEKCPKCGEMKTHAHKFKSTDGGPDVCYCGKKKQVPAKPNEVKKLDEALTEIGFTVMNMTVEVDPYKGELPVYTVEAEYPITGDGPYGNTKEIADHLEKKGFGLQKHVYKVKANGDTDHTMQVFPLPPLMTKHGKAIDDFKIDPVAFAEAMGAESVPPGWEGKYEALKKIAQTKPEHKHAWQFTTGDASIYCPCGATEDDPELIKALTLESEKGPVMFKGNPVTVKVTQEQAKEMLTDGPSPHQEEPEIELLQNALEEMGFTVTGKSIENDPSKGPGPVYTIDAVMEATDNGPFTDGMKVAEHLSKHGFDLMKHGCAIKANGDTLHEMRIVSIVQKTVKPGVKVTQEFVDAPKPITIPDFDKLEFPGIDSKSAPELNDILKTLQAENKDELVEVDPKGNVKVACQHQWVKSAYGGHVCAKCKLLKEIGFVGIDPAKGDDETVVTLGGLPIKIVAHKDMPDNALILLGNESFVVTKFEKKESQPIQELSFKGKQFQLPMKPYDATLEITASKLHGWPAPEKSTVQVTEEMLSDALKGHQKPKHKYEQGAIPMDLEKPITHYKFTADENIYEGDKVYLTGPNTVTNKPKPSQVKHIGYASHNAAAGCLLTVTTVNPKVSEIGAEVITIAYVGPFGHLSQHKLPLVKVGKYDCKVTVESLNSSGIMVKFESSQLGVVMNYAGEHEHGSAYAVVRVANVDGSMTYFIKRCLKGQEVVIQTQQVAASHPTAGMATHADMADHHHAKFDAEIIATEPTTAEPGAVLMDAHGREFMRITADGKIVVRADTFFSVQNKAVALSDFAKVFWESIEQKNPLRKKVHTMILQLEKLASENSTLAAWIQKVKAERAVPNYDPMANPAIDRFRNVARNLE